MSEQDIEVELLPAPHKPPSKLPSGKFAVYAFFRGKDCLKIGKAGTNSQARYVSQHYGFSAPSTLAKSIYSDRDGLTLASKAAELFDRSQTDEKRQLIGYLFANLQMEGGRVRYFLKKPFNLLQDLGDYKEWLPRKGSNLRPGD